MRYISTRGQAPAISFKAALLAGLARDGGLYVPETWPQWSADNFRALRGLPFADVATRVLSAFSGGDIPQDILHEIAKKAQEKFAHAATTPLVQISPDQFVLELFHGPTLAFKDVAMQILGQLMAYVLAESGQQATVIGATSGDTGSAAIEAFGGLPNVNVFILYPHNRVSEVQRRQMTTSPHDNVKCFAVEGTFDDCQNIVKSLFNDHEFRERVNLTGVNSINWVRIASQIVYYITSGVALGAPERAISYVVPTGNFGDIYAGYVARMMGLPIDKLVVATNQNDILARCFATGQYQLEAVQPSSSPSMDIQISSNFERLLYDAYGRDASQIQGLMHSLHTNKGFSVAAPQLAWMREFMAAYRADENEVAQMMRMMHETCHMLVDPHTAVGLVASQKMGALESPKVILSTAHPAKFPDAVVKATNIQPQLPAHLQHIMTRSERFEVMPNSVQAIAQAIG